MKKIVYYILIFLLIPSSALFAKHRDDKAIFKQLDKVMNEKNALQLRKEKEIEELKQQLTHSDEVLKKYNLCGSLFDTYLHYQADSALYYIDLQMDLLSSLRRPELKVELIIDRATVMGVMGMYN